MFSKNRRTRTVRCWQM